LGEGDVEVSTLIYDVKYALRMLRKSPGFTGIAILTIALGIGANTSIFSVVNAVLLRSLPFRHAEQLVAVKDDLPGLGLTDTGMSQPELDDLQIRSGVFDQISAVWPINANITGAEKPQRVEGQAVSFNYFTLLGANAKLGRTIEPSDYQPGFTEAAVISDGLWQRMYGGDPAVIGRAMRLDSDLYRIVGVMPPGFRHPGVTLEHEVDVWVAAGFADNPFPKPTVRAMRMIPGAIGRLKPGMSVAKAQAQLDAFTAQLRGQYPTDYPATARWTIRLVPLRKEVVGNSSAMLFVLLASVGLVLLIACVNIASLLLARSAGRYREIAVRRALGASRGRLIRQTLTESVVLAVAGGALGLVLNSWLISILLKMVPSNLPRAGEVVTDSRVLLFAFGLSILTGLLFGLAPAVQLSDPQLIESLKEGTRGGGIGSRQNRFLSALVVSEFALSLILLVGAGLLLRSFWNLLEVRPGFDSSHLVMARVWLPVPNDPNFNIYRTPEKRGAFVHEVVRRVSALPGVADAAIGSNSAPLLAQRNRRAFTVEGRPVAAGGAPYAEFSAVTPDFFRVLGIPLIRGHFFTDADDTKGLPVALIDQTAAEHFWPNEDPVGKRLLRGFQAGPNPQWLTIAGVVGKTKTDALDAPYAPHIYLSELQSSDYAMDVYIRGNASAESLEEPVRREIQAVDPNLPVFGVRTLESVVSDSLASRRFAMRMLGFFAAIALLLAGIGIYGVMAYFVSQRTREIGIRVALGAAPSHISKLILGRGMALTAAGILAGMIGAAALTQSLASLVFGVAPIDPLTFAAGAVVLAGVALAACYIPARRAMRVDPMVALRYE
jgi:predicted permease